MRVIAATAAVSLLSLPFITGAVTAQNGGIAAGHRPNEHTETCLRDLSRGCAINAAMQTVIGEELGLERARVLVGVARSLIEINDRDRAVQTLLLALEEARSVRLTLITQEKIKEIAPLLARAGDAAAGIGFAREIQIDSLRDNVMAAIAAEAIKAGDLAGALSAVGEIKNSTRAFWEELRAYSSAPMDQLTVSKLDELEARVRAQEAAHEKYRGLIHLAIIADHQGDGARAAALLAEATDIFPAIQSLQQRGQAALLRLRAVQEAGLPEEQLMQAYEHALLHGERVRGGDAQKDLTRQIGAIEMRIGFFEQAIARLGIFDTPEERARYLASLVSPDGVNMLSPYYAETLNALASVDGPYERDQARLALLEGAIGNRSVDLATSIVTALEDDDNQALGLALMAPLLE